MLIFFDLQVKAKTITEIHTEAEKNMGLCAGSTASIRNSCALAAGSQTPVGLNRPGTGGMMPGAPGSRPMPGTPGLDNDNWEVQRSRSMPRGVQPPLFNKTPLQSQRFLPQGSGGFISGKPSALLQGSGGGAAPPVVSPAARPIPTLSPTPVVSAAVPLKANDWVPRKEKVVTYSISYLIVYACLQIKC